MKYKKVSIVGIGHSGANNVERFMKFIEESEDLDTEFKDMIYKNSYMIGYIPNIDPNQRYKRIREKLLLDEMPDSIEKMYNIYKKNVENMKAFVNRVSKDSDIIVLISGESDKYSLFLTPFLLQFFITLFPQKIVFLFSIFHMKEGSRKDMRLIHRLGAIQKIRKNILNRQNNFVHLLINSSEFDYSTKIHTTMGAAMFSILSPFLEVSSIRDISTEIENMAEMNDITISCSMPLENLVKPLNSMVIPYIIMPFEEDDINYKDLGDFMKESSIATKSFFDSEDFNGKLDRILGDVEKKAYDFSKINGPIDVLYVPSPSQAIPLSSVSIFMIAPELDIRHVNYLKYIKNFLENKTNFVYVDPYEGSLIINRSLKDNIEIFWKPSKETPKLVIYLNGARSLSMVKALHSAESYVNREFSEDTNIYKIQSNMKKMGICLDTLQEIEKYVGKEYIVFSLKREELYYDSIVETMIETEDGLLGTKEQRLLIYKDLVFQALADDTITEDEEAILSKFREIAGISQEEHEALVSQAKAIYSILNINKKRSEEIYDIFEKVALQDKVITADEEELLEIIRRYLGFERMKK